ncbi:unnamed protein product, partial [Prorocentrum cordatum]
GIQRPCVGYGRFLRPAGQSRRWVDAALGPPRDALRMELALAADATPRELPNEAASDRAAPCLRTRPRKQRPAEKFGIPAFFDSAHFQHASQRVLDAADASQIDADAISGGIGAELPGSNARAARRRDFKLSVSAAARWVNGAHLWRATVDAASAFDAMGAHAVADVVRALVGDERRAMAAARITDRMKWIYPRRYSREPPTPAADGLPAACDAGARDLGRHPPAATRPTAHSLGGFIGPTDKLRGPSVKRRDRAGRLAESRAPLQPSSNQCNAAAAACSARSCWFAFMKFRRWARMPARRASTVNFFRSQLKWRRERPPVNRASSGGKIARWLLEGKVAMPLAGDTGKNRRAAQRAPWKARPRALQGRLYEDTVASTIRGRLAARRLAAQGANALDLQLLVAIGAVGPRPANLPRILGGPRVGPPRMMVASSDAACSDSNAHPQIWRAADFGRVPRWIPIPRSRAWPITQAPAQGWATSQGVQRSSVTQRAQGAGVIPHCSVDSRSSALDSIARMAVARAFCHSTKDMPTGTRWLALRRG